MATKTMTILGDTGEITTELLMVLTRHGLRLLFVAKDEVSKNEVIQQLKPLNSNTEIDFTSCEKEGCWEADEIVLLKSEETSIALIKKIREVATQKPVWMFSGNPATTNKVNLKEILIHSKVVEIRLNEKTKEFSLCSKEVEAKEEIRQLLETSGYKTK